MNKIYFYSSGKLHWAHKHMMELVPEGFVAETKEFSANPFAKATTGDASLKNNLMKTVNPWVSTAYNNFHILLGMPKKRVFPGDGYDLVHSTQALLETDVPYVVDFEHASVFSGYNQYAFKYKPFLQALARELENKKLKKAIAWSKHAERSMTNFIKTDKVETVYPCANFPKAKPKKKGGDSVDFLFIGRTFYQKGGYEAALAFDRISDKYDATFTVITNLPKEQMPFAKNEKIKMLELQPYEKIVEFYENSDVFVFPTHYDTYGFVIPEAFSFGLPVIGVDSFSSPELIGHEKTGLIVKSYFSSFADDEGYTWPTIHEVSKKRLELSKKPPEWYIQSLSEAMERLIVDGKLRSRLSRAAYLETSEGKFSEGEYKKKMGRIYEEAVG